eukprot:15330271-Ditylum_brightwellii.AAC.1
MRGTDLIPLVASSGSNYLSMGMMGMMRIPTFTRIILMGCEKMSGLPPTLCFKLGKGRHH